MSTAAAIIGSRRREESRSRRSTLKAIVGAGIVIYSILTILPFYFLAIRTIVPTTESTRLWLWPPAQREVNMKARIGDYSAQFNLDVRRFKEEFGITGYLDPNMTLSGLADTYSLDEERIRVYFRPYVNYSGWMMVFNDGRYVRSLLVTAYVVITGILVGGFLSIMTGSVLAKFTRRYHMWVYRFYLLETIIPPIIILIPLYIILTRWLGLRNSYLSLILIYIKGGALPTVLFTTYFSSIPNELEESVYVDGGSRLTYFGRILLPLSKTAFAAFTCVRLPKYWNDLVTGLVLLDPEKYTIVPLVSSLSGKFTTNFQAIYSGLALSLIPVILLYLLFNRLFIRAQLAGAIKG